MLGTDESETGQPVESHHLSRFDVSCLPADGHSVRHEICARGMRMSWLINLVRGSWKAKKKRGAGFLTRLFPARDSSLRWLGNPPHNINSYRACSLR